MNWLQSDGGPFVIMPAFIFPHWNGALEDDPTHYDLACSTMNYIDVMDFQNNDVLVLNEEPMPVLRDFEWCQFNPITIVRWSYGEPDAIYDYLADINTVNWRETSILINIQNQPYYLFCASSSNNMVDLDNDVIIINLEAGAYNVQEGVYEPNKNVRLVLHRLIKTK